MGSRPGRVALDKLVSEWSDNCPLNPRHLAAEVADTIRSMSQPETIIPRDRVVIMGLVEPTSGVDSLRMWDLADFFYAVNAGLTPTEISTANGSTRIGAVLLARSWIDTLVEEAEDRAAAAAGYLTMTGAPSEHFYGNAAPAHNKPEQRSGSDPELLVLRQEQLRQQGQHDLAENFEAERIARFEAESEVSELRVRVKQLELIQEDNELLRRELNEERRGRVETEEKLTEALDKASGEQTARLVAESKLQDLKDLKSLLDKVSNWASPVKEIDPRERATFERLLYVLAREAKYPLEGECYPDEAALIKYADLIGATVPTGKGVIAAKLKNAIDRCIKDKKERKDQ